MEEFASAYVTQYVLPHWLSVYGLAAAGGLIGWLWSRLSGQTATLGRVPYFVRLCLAILFVCVVEIATVKGGDASVWGVATRLAVLLTAAPLIGGFYVGRIAAARSRDAAGHPNGALLAFIPLANLWLLFKASRTRTAEPFGLMHGEEGAIFGLILLVLAGGAIWLEVVVRTAMPNVDGMIQMIEVALTKHQISDQGLQKALEEYIASVVEISSAYDGDYLYDGVNVEQNVITFTLKARWPGKSAGQQVQRKRQSTLCGNLSTAEYLKAGAVFRTVFLDSDGRAETTVATSAKDCGPLPSIVPWWALPVAELGWPNALTLEGETPNEQAINFLILPDGKIWLASLSLMMLGGLATAAFPSRGTLGRAPYFAGNSILVLVAAGSRALLIPTPAAMAGERLAAMAAIWALVQVALGVVLWRLAARRSRDVHGHAWAAPLAFIPGLNLWLLIAPPTGGQAPDSAVARPAYSPRQVASVLVALALLGGSYWAAGAVEDATSRALLGDEAPSELWIRLAINNDGIENVLKGLAGARNPEPLPGEAFTLTRMRADGLHLYETWTVNKAGGRFSLRQQAQFKEYHCSVVDDVSLMKAGAILHHAYVAPSGRTLGTIKVSKDICGL